MKNATAISPLAMNAAGRVNSPIMMRNPPSVSITPAGPWGHDMGDTACPPNHPIVFCSP